MICIYLGIDLGTTACKTVMFTCDGDVLCEHNREYPLIIRDDAVLQDAEQWWEQICIGIRETVRVSGENEINGISVSTQGISVVPVDEHGTVLSEAISWLDMRPEREMSLLIEKFGENKIFSLTGKHPSASYTLPKLMYIKHTMADVFARTAKFLLPLDFINMKLTGRALTDFTIAGGTMAFDMQNRCWNEEMLSFAGVDSSKLPEVGCMGDFVGTVKKEVADELGIYGKLNVFLGGQDQKLAAIGAGIADDVVTVSIGTATAVTRLLDRIPETAEYSVFPFDRERFSAEGVLRTSGSALKWLSRTMFGGLSYREMDILCEDAGSSDGVVFSPDFSVNASISGLTLKSTRGNIVYALYEGVSREITSAVRDMGGAEALRVFGGGAKSEIWCRILTDVSGVPVMMCNTTETASRGAARLASEFTIDAAPVVRIIKPNK